MQDRENAVEAATSRVGAGSFCIGDKPKTYADSKAADEVALRLIRMSEEGQSAADDKLIVLRETLADGRRIFHRIEARPAWARPILRDQANFRPKVGAMSTLEASMREKLDKAAVLFPSRASEVDRVHQEFDRDVVKVLPSNLDHSRGF